MSERQQRRQPNSFHRTRYAYHEAGHAVAGHVIGRCMSEVSIQSDKNRGYRGYCAFDAFAEDLQGLPQWRDGSKNPECTTIMYAGTTALRILCEQQGWKYEHWRGIDKADVATISLWFLDMFDTDEERQTMQRECSLQAEAILTSHWNAVEILATALLKQDWLAGGKAHTLIREALGETGYEWRLKGGRLLDHPVEYRISDEQY